jgi:hypothetical protein
METFSHVFGFVDSETAGGGGGMDGGGGTGRRAGGGGGKASGGGGGIECPFMLNHSRRECQDDTTDLEGADEEDHFIAIDSKSRE